jgi:hypothetical protein
MKRLSIVNILVIGFILGFISQSEAQTGPQMGGIIRGGAELYEQAKKYKEKLQIMYSGKIDIASPPYGKVVKDNLSIGTDLFEFPPESVDGVIFYISKDPYSLGDYIGQSDLGPRLVPPECSDPSFVGCGKIVYNTSELPNGDYYIHAIPRVTSTPERLLPSITL